MKLHVGERVPGSGPAGQPGGYVVSSVLTETPWHGLYAARRVFHHFDFNARRPREVEEREWLEVTLRTIQYLQLDDPMYVAGRRALVRHEAQHILAAREHSAWPAVFDLLEVENPRDAFKFPAPRGSLSHEPILVLERRGGVPLARWRQDGPPVGAILRVLAALLRVVADAHAGGILLHGLGPGSLQIDGLGRPHLVATDLAVELSRAASCSLTGLLPDTTLEWGRFFPPERFPRGFAPPECFDPTKPRDRRTDLYSWAMLVYFLLTGDNPSQRAATQGTLWAQLGDEQLAVLEQTLRAIPPAQVSVWAEQLGVEAASLLRAWPRNVVTVLQMCVRPEARLRPASVTELCAWLLAPPPPPLAGALAVRVEGPLAAQLRAPPENGRRPEPGRTTARLFLDLTDLKTGTEVVVRRGAGCPPSTIEEGQPVAEGLPRPIVEDAPPGSASAEIRPVVYYGVFARQRHGNSVTASVATVAELLPARPEELLAYVEAGSRATADEETPRARLFFEALQPAAAAEVLLRSEIPELRVWAVRRLARDVQEPAARALLFRTLQDPTPGLRLEAARALFEGAVRPPVALVRQVVQALGRGNRDDTLRAARSLPSIGVAQDVVREALASFKGDDLVACPECKTALPAQERPTHLAAVHGYLDVNGILLPRAVGVARLWDRVFDAADRDAHGRLVELLLSQGADGTAYATAVEQEIQARADKLLAARWQEIPRLVQCLRAATAARAPLHRLLEAAHAGVREVAREVLLPDFGQALAGEEVTAAEVRRQLDLLCPREGPEEKLRLCRRLPQFGLPVAVADEVVRQLQQEVPVACTECGARVRRADLDNHLRQAHRIYQFRGQRRPLNETVAVLLASVLGASPDYEAWQTLEVIAQELYGPGAAGFLAAALGQALGKFSDDVRAKGIRAGAEVIVAGALGARLAMLLASDTAAPARLLALALPERLPAPLDSGVLRALLPLLLDRRLPNDEQVAAAAALLRTTGRAGRAATEVLNALVAGQSKARAVDRLRQLERLAGTSPALDDLTARLEDQVRMQCPRCPVRLRRVEMVHHLWDEHGLVLDGRRVREPWRLIEDWIEEYHADPQPELLARCKALGERLDPVEGLHRVYRLLLSKNVEDPEAQQVLLAEAEQQGASLCPHCYAAVPVPRPVPLPMMNLWRGRLSTRGYRVEVSEAGLFTRLEAETPTAPVRSGPVPERALTSSGAILLLAGPLVVLALLLALILPSLGVAPFIPVLLVLMLALAVYYFARAFWRPVRAALDRALDYAWSGFVPQLHADGFSSADSAFIASLALTSLRQGRDKVPRGVFDVVEDLTEHAVAQGAGVAEHLAALKRLAITQAVAAGQDPVPQVATQVARCFEGRLPLSFAEALLADWETEWWTRGNLNRLRALLADRAFEAGYEVRNLLESGRAAPALDAVLQTDDLRALAQLRLLWSLRPRQPWERCGEARTIFEIALDVESATLLTKYADVLLVQDYPSLALLDRDGSTLHNVQIVICCRGVAFCGVLFGEAPRSVEVVTKRARSEGIYELLLDGQRFRFLQDPEPLVGRLERWFRFYFKDFLPQSAGVHRWQSPNVAVALRAQQAVPCPQCQRPVVTRAGQVGTPADGTSEQVEASPVKE